MENGESLNLSEYVDIEALDWSAEGIESDCHEITELREYKEICPQVFRFIIETLFADQIRDRNIVKSGNRGLPKEEKSKIPPIVKKYKIDLSGLGVIDGRSLASLKKHFLEINIPDSALTLSEESFERLLYIEDMQLVPGGKKEVPVTKISEDGLKNNINGFEHFKAATPEGVRALVEHMHAHFGLEAAISVLNLNGLETIDALTMFELSKFRGYTNLLGLKEVSGVVFSQLHSRKDKYNFNPKKLKERPSVEPDRGVLPYRSTTRRHTLDILK